MTSPRPNLFRFLLVACATLLAGAGLVTLAESVQAYPLDGDEYTGIIRLRGYRELQERLLQRGTLQPGSLFGMETVRLALVDRPEFTLPEPDPKLSARLRGLLGAQADRYSVAVLDLSDLDAIHYFAHRPNEHQNPGSVGKLVVGLAWFQALADRFPDDTEARARLLRESEVVSDTYIRTDSHEVPFWQPGQERIIKRPLREGDRASLWTFLDFMMSSSSNAAASMVMQHLVSFRHFGEAYPVPPELNREFLTQTPARELGAQVSDALRSPLERNGIDPAALRQGGLFTHEGKRRMPAGDSTSTAAELLHFLTLMEQGRLVDEWSSLELKRLLYLTERRIRYASHPAMKDAAIYFKSGSLYNCREEEGFVCRKYHGNVRNFMNSVAIVETHDPARELHYLVVVLSNVLRENSAVVHQTLALRIHRLIEELHPPRALPEPETLAEPGPAPAAEGDGDGEGVREPEGVWKAAPSARRELERIPAATLPEGPSE